MDHFSYVPVLVTAGLLQACIEAGAKFIVSPSLNEETIQFCRAQDVAIFAGALTP